MRVPKNFRSHVVVLIIVLIVVPFIAGGCYTYSSLQSARLVDQGQYEVTPSYSSQSVSVSEVSEKIADQYGVQLAVGTGRRTNTRLRYERISLADEGGDASYNFASVETKVSLIQDALALSMPVGLWFGDDVKEGESWQIHPSLHATAMVNPNVEINASAKLLYFFNEDMDELYGFNVGLGLGNMDKLILRPEIGWLVSPDSDGHYFHWSVGVSFYTH